MPGLVEYVGTPAAYVYLDGRLEESSKVRAKSTVERRFCVNCGSELPSSAKYCPMCSEKQEFELPPPANMVIDVFWPQPRLRN